MFLNDQTNVPEFRPDVHFDGQSDRIVESNGSRGMIHDGNIFFQRLHVFGRNAQFRLVNIAIDWDDLRGETRVLKITRKETGKMCSQK